MKPDECASQTEIDELMKDPRFKSLAAIGEALKDLPKDLPLEEIERQITQSLRAGRERLRRERIQSSESE